MKEIGIYIHIPFCQKRCLYCDFYSTITYEHKIFKYIEAVMKEIALRDEFADYPVASVYIGGGTPSILDPQWLTLIINALKTRYFLSVRCEITLEANPFSFEDEKVDALIDIGITRLSLGIQSLNDRELETIGRIHNRQHCLLALETARRSGFSNISVDLIYGLPGQTVEDWTNTLKGIIDYRPNHISTYELTLSEGTSLYEKVRYGLMTLPEEASVEEMYFQAIDMFEGAGYRHYEVSNFSMPGFECVHNINYWRRGIYMGFGAGAHSFDGLIRSSNVADVDRYMEMLCQDNLPIIDSFHLDNSDVLKEEIFLGIRTSEGIPKGLLSGKEQRLKSLESQGLIEIDNNRVRLTKRGFILSNEVILQLW